MNQVISQGLKEDKTNVIVSLSNKSKLSHISTRVQITPLLRKAALSFNEDPKLLIDLYETNKQIHDLKALHYVIKHLSNRPMFMSLLVFGKHIGKVHKSTMSRITTIFNICGVVLKKKNPYRSCDYFLSKVFTDPHFKTYVFRLIKQAIRRLDGWCQRIVTKSYNSWFKMTRKVAVGSSAPLADSFAISSGSCDGAALFDAFCASSLFLRELGRATGPVSERIFGTSVFCQ